MAKSVFVAEVPAKGENAVTRIYGYMARFSNETNNDWEVSPTSHQKIKEKSQAKSHQHTNANALQKSKHKFRVLGAELRQPLKKPI